MKTEKTYYFPYVRRGLSNCISEQDTLGTETETEAIERCQVQISAKMLATSVNTENADRKSKEQEEPKQYGITQSKIVNIVGPGDVMGVNRPAISKIMPSDQFVGFSIDYFPYIEFWESDFAWRYTPAAPVVGEGNNVQRLRPWLALIVCEAEKCKVSQNMSGRSVVELKIADEDEYAAIFVRQQDTWKMAHAQGYISDKAEFCRLLALRRSENVDGKWQPVKLKEGIEYTVMLVPTFETGRLKGLGKNCTGVLAQKWAWEDTLADQKAKHEDPLSFPVYFSWSYVTGGQSFDSLVENLAPKTPDKSSIKVDVTAMGNGFDYSLFDENSQPKRRVMDMPAPVRVPGEKDTPTFPNEAVADEKPLAERLKEILSMNPVFNDNLEEIGRVDGCDISQETDDPWITPPVYGARHIMATSLDKELNEKNNTQWLTQLNLDTQYRAVAGLGKRTVQLNQEEFMNRAWKQIDVVQAMNRKLYAALASYKTGISTQSRMYEWIDGSSDHFIANLMRNLGGTIDMKADNGVSLASILKGKNIPESFASASFQRESEHVAELTNDMNTTTMMENIAANQIFKFDSYEQKYTINGQWIISLFEKFGSVAYDYFLYFLFQSQSCLLSYYFSLERKGTIQDWCFKRGGVNYFDIQSDFLLRFNGVKATHCCWGKTSSEMHLMIGQLSRSGNTSRLSHNYYYNGSDCDVVGLPSKLYETYFGTTYPVTRLAEDIESDTGSITKSIYFFSYEDKKVQDCKGICLGTAKLSGYIIKFEGIGGVPVFGPDIMVEAIKIFEPSIIAKSGLLQVFAKPIDYYNFIIEKVKNPSSGSATAMAENLKDLQGIYEASMEYKNLSDYLNNEINRVKTDDVTVPASVTDENVQTLQTAFLDNEAYNRVKEVAANYYNNFFSNKDLVDQYLDELLMSKYPIMAYPLFPEPTYYYLKAFSEKFILPCVHDLPQESVAMFESNNKFVEAYLCGMNTEMGEELMWREYPTDRRGSYFRKFWDSETSVADISKNNYFDVHPLHTWQGDLGKNMADGKGDIIIFAVKSKLMKQFPDTQITLHKAALDDSYFTKRGVFQLTFAKGKDVEMLPVITAYLTEEVYIVGFKTDLSTLLGNAPDDKFHSDNYGYMLTFKQREEDLNFELNDREADDLANAENSAQYAKVLIDMPTIYGLHISHFLTTKQLKIEKHESK